MYILVPLIAAIAFTALSYYVPALYQASYSFFFAALLVTIFTDAQYMLISRFVTVYLLPVPIVLSMLGLLPISPEQVMLGALSGYFVLAGISYVFSLLMNKQGMGQGDIDLLCFIGAFLGLGGWWISLLMASCVGSLFGIVYLLASGQGKQTKIPFGPFLAFGAMIYTIWGEWLFALIFPTF